MKHQHKNNILSLLHILFIVTSVSIFVFDNAESSCSSPANAIETENCLPGTPQGTWDILSRDAGDPSIQGFATNISVNKGSTINFKVNTPGQRLAA